MAMHPMKKALLAIFGLIIFLILFAPMMFISIVLAFAPNPKVDVKTVTKKHPHLKFVKLPDGRVLEYQIAGAGTMQKVVIGNHGFGQSCGMYMFNFEIELYKKLGLDVISISQPGFGFSDSVNRFVTRNVKDWGKDVEHVLNAEKVDKFYVMGTSAGGMHALSLVNEFPDRVLGGAIIAPTCPGDVESEIGVDKAIAPATKVARKLMAMRFVGDLFAFIMSIAGGEVRANITPDLKKALIKLRSEGQGSLCDEFLKDASMATSHTFRCWTDNMRTLNNWSKSSLNLTEIQQKLVVAYAEDDTTNPPTMQKWVHSQLKNGILLKVDSGYGHLFSICTENFEKILKVMLENTDETKIA
jgi:pimeloyl-ACP methyl ester carboxylesterase